MGLLLTCVGGETSWERFGTNEVAALCLRKRFLTTVIAAAIHLAAGPMSAGEKGGRTGPALGPVGRRRSASRVRGPRGWCLHVGAVFEGGFSALLADCRSWWSNAVIRLAITHCAHVSISDDVL